MNVSKTVKKLGQPGQYVITLVLVSDLPRKMSIKFAYLWLIINKNFEFMQYLTFLENNKIIHIDYVKGNLYLKLINLVITTIVSI